VYCNVTLRRVCLIIFAVEEQKLLNIISVCVCVCVCVPSHVRFEVHTTITTKVVSCM